jgi:phosphomethylpyrimidine synthase
VWARVVDDVRKYAAEEEAPKKGMEEKSREFTEKGSELYAKA